ncbi:hypothetical protein BJ742DRAFT_868876 [Cladochytrium replicatum]|nr:hypothetical protein BJ742DRAFT_868876 [Cladochytrium replicatum]
MSLFSPTELGKVLKPQKSTEQNQAENNASRSIHYVHQESSRRVSGQRGSPLLEGNSLINNDGLRNSKPQAAASSDFRGSDLKRNTPPPEEDSDEDDRPIGLQTQSESNAKADSRTALKDDETKTVIEIDKTLVEATPPQYRDVVELFHTYAHKRYSSGLVYMRQLLPESSGQPGNPTGWEKLWAELWGPVLLVWNVPEVIANAAFTPVPTVNRIVELEVAPSDEVIDVIKSSQETPRFFNIADCVSDIIPISSLQSGPTAGLPPAPYTNFISLCTEGSRVLNLAVQSTIVCNSWVASIRLSSFEAMKMNELYTYRLLQSPEYSSAWSDLKVPPFKTRDCTLPEGVVWEGSLSVRLAQWEEFLPVYAVVMTSDRNQRAQVEEQNKVNETSKASEVKKQKSWFGIKKKKSEDISLPPTPKVMEQSVGKVTVNVPLIKMFKDKSEFSKGPPICSVSGVRQVAAIWPERADLIQLGVSGLFKIEGTVSVSSSTTVSNRASTLLSFEGPTDKAEDPQANLTGPVSGNSNLGSPTASHALILAQSTSDMSRWLVAILSAFRLDLQSCQVPELEVGTLRNQRIRFLEELDLLHNLDGQAHPQWGLLYLSGVEVAGLSMSNPNLPPSAIDMRSTVSQFNQLLAEKMGVLRDGRLLNWNMAVQQGRQSRDIFTRREAEAKANELISWLQIVQPERFAVVQASVNPHVEGVKPSLQNTPKPSALALSQRRVSKNSSAKSTPQSTPNTSRRQTPTYASVSFSRPISIAIENPTTSAKSQKAIPDFGTPGERRKSLGDEPTFDETVVSTVPVSSTRLKQPTSPSKTKTASSKSKNTPESKGSDFDMSFLRDVFSAMNLVDASTLGSFSPVGKTNFTVPEMLFTPPTLRKGAPTGDLEKGTTVSPKIPSKKDINNDGSESDESPRRSMQIKRAARKLGKQRSESDEENKGDESEENNEGDDTDEGDQSDDGEENSDSGDSEDSVEESEDSVEESEDSVEESEASKQSSDAAGIGRISHGKGKDHNEDITLVRGGTNTRSHDDMGNMNAPGYGIEPLPNMMTYVPHPFFAQSMPVNAPFPPQFPQFAGPAPFLPVGTGFPGFPPGMFPQPGMVPTGEFGMAQQLPQAPPDDDEDAPLGLANQAPFYPADSLLAQAAMKKAMRRNPYTGNIGAAPENGPLLGFVPNPTTARDPYLPPGFDPQMMQQHFAMGGPLLGHVNKEAAKPRLEGGLLGELDRRKKDKEIFKQMIRTQTAIAVGAAPPNFMNNVRPQPIPASLNPFAPYGGNGMGMAPPQLSQQQMMFSGQPNPVIPGYGQQQPVVPPNVNPGLHQNATYPVSEFGPEFADDQRQMMQRDMLRSEWLEMERNKERHRMFEREREFQVAAQQGLPPQGIFWNRANSYSDSSGSNQLPQVQPITQAGNPQKPGRRSDRSSDTESSLPESESESSNERTEEDTKKRSRGKHAGAKSTHKSSKVTHTSEKRRTGRGRRGRSDSDNPQNEDEGKGSMRSPIKMKPKNRGPTSLGEPRGTGDHSSKLNKREQRRKARKKDSENYQSDGSRRSSSKKKNMKKSRVKKVQSSDDSDAEASEDHVDTSPKRSKGTAVRSLTPHDADLSEKDVKSKPRHKDSDKKKSRKTTKKGTTSSDNNSSNQEDNPKAKGKSKAKAKRSAKTKESDSDAPLAHAIPSGEISRHSSFGLSGATMGPHAPKNDLQNGVSLSNHPSYIVRPGNWQGGMPKNNLESAPRNSEKRKEKEKRGYRKSGKGGVKKGKTKPPSFSEEEESD